MSGFVPCFPCPLGTYQPDEGKISCYKCPHGADTLSTAATNITDCEGNNILDQALKNGPLSPILYMWKMVIR